MHNIIFTPKTLALVTLLFRKRVCNKPYFYCQDIYHVTLKAHII